MHSKTNVEFEKLVLAMNNFIDWVSKKKPKYVD